MQASDIRQLRDLEAENALLKRMFADLGLKTRHSRLLLQKSFEPAEKRELITFMH